MVPSEWFDRREHYPGTKMTPEQRVAAMDRLAAGRATRDAKAAAADPYQTISRRKTTARTKRSA